jgi:hypothetical protein
VIGNHNAGRATFDANLSGFDAVWNEKMSHVNVPGSFAARSPSASLKQDGALVVLMQDIVVNLAPLGLQATQCPLHLWHDIVSTSYLSFGRALCV